MPNLSPGFNNETPAKPDDADQEIELIVWVDRSQKEELFPQLMKCSLGFLRRFFQMRGLLFLNTSRFPVTPIPQKNLPQKIFFKCGNSINMTLELIPFNHPWRRQYVE